VCSLAFQVGALIEASSNGFGTMVFGRIVAGLGVGCLSCVVPMYTAEMSPPSVRGMLNSLYQLMLTIGILTAFVVNTSTRGGRSGWRTSLGLSCVLSFTLMLGMSCFPETPSWLLKNKNQYDAEQALKRLSVALFGATAVCMYFCCRDDSACLSEVRAARQSN
jgi:MFS family permease